MKTQVRLAPVADAAPPRSRFRGLGSRVAAALVFLPCFLIIAWRGDVYFVLLVNFISVAGTFEFIRMLEAKGLKPQRVAALVAAFVLPWLAFWRGGIYMDCGLAILLVSVLTTELVRSTGQALAQVSGAVFGVMYVAWLSSHLVALRELPLQVGQPYGLGFRAVGLVFITTWMADTGAYLVGSLVGRHKLAPRISPGKSVEGALGGLAVAIASGAVYAHLCMRQEMSMGAGAWIGALAAVAGLAGDLAESLMKRDAAVKDASGAIPGHGGALDRFDSVLFTAPLIYYALRFVVL